MEKNNTTALEWLEDNLIGNPHTENDFMHNRNVFKQAKQMEKEQIMKAVYDSMGTNFDPNWGRAEMYYNETYNK